MTQKEMVDLISKLYDCSIYMKEINMEISDILLNLSRELLDKLEREVVPADVNREIEEIQSELGDD